MVKNLYPFLSNLESKQFKTANAASALNIFETTRNLDSRQLSDFFKFALQPSRFKLVSQLNNHREPRAHTNC